MASDGSHAFERWEIEVATKLVREFKRTSRSLVHDDFEDLLQECLMRWFEVRQRLTPQADGPPLAYMARVLRN